MKKAIFLFKKLKTILNRIRKHDSFGRKFLTFAHVPRLEKLYLWPVNETPEENTKLSNYALRIL